MKYVFLSSFSHCIKYILKERNKGIFNSHFLKTTKKAKEDQSKIKLQKQLQPLNNSDTNTGTASVWQNMHQTGRRQRDSQAAFLFPGPLAIFFLELQKHPSLEIKQDIKKIFFNYLIL